MQLYNRGQQKPRWKDLMTSNVETRTHANELGVREGIGSEWSCRF